MARNHASAKAAGRNWENAIVDALIENGWPHAERRRQAGANDKGDIAGVPGVVIEAKNTAKFTPAAFVAEAKAEAENAKADVWAAWIKKRGKSAATEGYVLMDGQMFMDFLKKAGY